MPAHPTLKSLLRHLNGYDAIPYYTSNLVAGGGFEPPKLSRQIYSLIPLAARESRLNFFFKLAIPSLSVPLFIHQHETGRRFHIPSFVCVILISWLTPGIK